MALTRAAAGDPLDAMGRLYRRDGHVLKKGFAVPAAAAIAMPPTSIAGPPNNLLMTILPWCAPCRRLYLIQVAFCRRPLGIDPLLPQAAKPPSIIPVTRAGDMEQL